jgi:hypothetical protein
MKTMQTNINPTRELLLNKDFYKTIYANQLCKNDINKNIYFIHNRGISCRKITKLTNRHFTHSAIDNNSSAEALISHFEFPMYMDISRDKLFDISTRIILDNNSGNKKTNSVMEFFNNRYLVSYTSSFLE